MSGRSLKMIAVFVTLAIGSTSMSAIPASAEELLGTPGSETLQGSKKSDTLVGRQGDDRLRGGKGKDRLIGGPDDDLLEGGSKSDVYEFHTNFGEDIIRDESGSIDKVRFLEDRFADVGSKSEAKI